MTDDWAPRGIDTETPSVARMYDYYLGGKDHFSSDRAAADKVIAALPDVPALAQANRAFLQRTVHYLASECGIDQFIDMGAGLPTAGNVHQVAQEINPRARVVYVDNDPIVLAHARALMEQESERVIVEEADLREPHQVLSNPRVRNLIDFSRPVAVLFVATLHFVSDDEDPAGIVSTFRDAMAPGSYLVLSHVARGTADRTTADTTADAAYGRATANIVFRDEDQVRKLFEGFQLTAPGLIDVAEWHPDGESVPTRLAGIAGVAQLR